MKLKVLQLCGRKKGLRVRALLVSSLALAVSLLSLAQTKPQEELIIRLPALAGSKGSDGEGALRSPRSSSQLCPIDWSEQSDRKVKVDSMGTQFLG